MKLKDFKTAAGTLGTTGISECLFGYKQIFNTEKIKSYPYVGWDFGTWKGTINWKHSTQIKEEIKARVYVIDYIDRSQINDYDDQIDKWDSLRTIARAYMALLNTNSQILITNLDKMSFEYFDYGITVDSEIGIGFDIEMTLFCL